MSPPGNFYGSTLVELRTGDPPATDACRSPPDSRSIEAIDVAAPGQALMLKWPNDVLLLGRKLAGILLERSGDRVVIGFGVNLASAPALPDRECASLSGRVTPQAFAPLLADSFERLLKLWRTSEPLLLAQAWLARAHPVGTRAHRPFGGERDDGGRFEGHRSRRRAAPAARRRQARDRSGRRRRVVNAPGHR